MTTRAVKVYLTAASQGTDFGQDTARYAMNLERPEWTYQWIPGDVTTTDGINVLGYTGGTPGAWRRLAHEDQGAALTDASATVYVSGDSWRRLPAGTLTASRTLTLGTTNARAGYDLTISVEGTGAYAYTLANGGTNGGTLGTFSGAGFIHAQFDGTDWKVRGFGGNVASGASPGAQAVWYINSSTGSDGASGASTAPLRTVGELLRRLRGVTVTSSTVDVYLTGSFASETLHWDLTLDSNVYFTVYGVRTSVLTGTLTTGTRNWDYTVPQDGRVVDSALATSWTSSLGANINGLIKITTAGGVATAWIAADLGSKTARVSCPMLADYTAATIASGNAYTVYTLTALGADVTFNLKMGHGAYLLVSDCEIATAGALHGIEVVGGDSNFATCSLNGLDVYGNSTMATLGCKFGHGPRPQRGAVINSYYDLAISTSSSAQCRDGAQFFANNLACQGMQYVCAGGTTIVPTGAWLAVYDPNASASGNGVDVLAGATLKSVGRIFGTTSATGTNSAIFVDAGGCATYNTSAANLLPAITGATNDTKIGGTVKTFAQLPYVDTTNGATFGGTTFPRG